MKILRMSLIWNGERMLFKKMLRDIRKHKAQFLSIFLMAFLGVFVFAGVGGESVGLEVNVNDYIMTPTWLTVGFTQSTLMICFYIRLIVWVQPLKWNGSMLWIR